MSSFSYSISHVSLIRIFYLSDCLAGSSTLPLYVCKTHLSSTHISVRLNNQKTGILKGHTTTQDKRGQLFRKIVIGNPPRGQKTELASWSFILIERRDGRRYKSILMCILCSVDWLHGQELWRNTIGELWQRGVRNGCADRCVQMSIECKDRCVSREWSVTNNLSRAEV